MFRGGLSKTSTWPYSIRGICNLMARRQIMTAQEGKPGGTTRSFYLRDSYSDGDMREARILAKEKHLRESWRTHATNTSCCSHRHFRLPDRARSDRWRSRPE